MNKLYLIGNGFDLANGLKTKYSDFLLWYLQKETGILKSKHSNRHQGDLITLDTNGYSFDEINSLESFAKFFINGNCRCRCQNRLFENILQKTINSNWADIEYEYYQELCRIQKAYDKDNTEIINSREERIRELNKCMEKIKNQFIEYLRTLPTILSPIYTKKIQERFNYELDKYNFTSVLFLIFNYTNIIESYKEELYLKLRRANVQFIHIHGKLDDKQNPIIFGYGDEMDPYYNKIENLNSNEFLKNMKSFQYLTTSNYRNLNVFLYSEHYLVSIMGHSCGLSDRVLLNSIFNHEYCKGIRIFYHQIDDSETDYAEKTQQISRHFEPKNKNIMRNIIVPFDESISLS